MGHGPRDLRPDRYRARAAAREVPAVKRSLRTVHAWAQENVVTVIAVMAGVFVIAGTGLALRERNIETEQLPAVQAIGSPCRTAVARAREALGDQRQGLIVGLLAFACAQQSDYTDLSGCLRYPVVRRTPKCRVLFRKYGITAEVLEVFDEQIHAGNLTTVEGVDASGGNSPSGQPGEPGGSPTPGNNPGGAGGGSSQPPTLGQQIGGVVDTTTQTGCSTPGLNGQLPPVCP